MKFSDGNWMIQPGFDLIGPVEFFDVRKDEDSMTVLAAPRPIESRRNQLDIPLITVRYSSPIEEVIRVQIYRHKGQVKKTPEFQINEQNPKVNIAETEEQLSLSSGNLSVRVNKTGGWGFQFFDGEKQLTGSGNRDISHATGPDQTVYMKEQLHLGVGENIYGLGERFTSLVKNGQVVDIWNKDGGTSTEQAYKNIPFYLSNKGYGVFVNHPENVSFEVASEWVSKVQFSVTGEYLEYFIINGPTPKKVLENYTSLTGKPALPPAWSFGLWLTTSFTTNYDEETVNHFVEGMIERDIPLHVFHFDCFWMKAFHWTDFEWDAATFPDPEGMLKRLKDKGLKICVWINPYIAQESSLFDEGMQNGYLIKRPNGDVWQWDKWQPGMGIVDFTNPEACEWYASHLRRLVDMGVDSFKTDFGERIPTDVVYHDGSDPEKMHNYYSFIYNKLVFEVLEEKLGKNEAALFARSGTAGSQQFPVHWGGDCFASYESMAESVRGGLSLGLSGFGFWSHDIGGFESTAPADIYKRWAAFGLMSSHSRLHGNHSYRVPWLFDEESVDVMRFFTKLKCSLMPYLFASANESSQIGLPMMRAMMLEFPEDKATDYLDRQYMLGDSLLVAPVFNEQGDVSFYLPQGTWTHLLTGEEVQGGTWLEENHGYLSLPLYVRPNSIVAFGSDNTKPDYDYADNAQFHVFALEEGKSASAKIYNTGAEEELTLEVSREGEVLTIVATGASKPWSVVLRGVESVSAADNAKVENTDQGVQIVPENGAKTISVKL